MDSLIVLVLAIGKDHFLAPMDQTFCSLDDQLFGDVLVPHLGDLLHQLSSVLRHRVTEHVMLK